MNASATAGIRNPLPNEVRSVVPARGVYESAALGLSWPLGLVMATDWKSNRTPAVKFSSLVILYSSCAYAASPPPLCCPKRSALTMSKLASKPAVIVFIRLSMSVVVASTAISSESDFVMPIALMVS